jgi:hypothetical protein
MKARRDEGVKTMQSTLKNLGAISKRYKSRSHPKFLFTSPPAFRRARKGLSIVEVIILMIVVVVAMGAVFVTMTWANRTYTFSRQDLGSRQLLFSWVEGFESLWRNASMDVGATAKQVTEMLGGSWDLSLSQGHIGFLTITAAEVLPRDVSSGKMKLHITILADRVSNSYNNKREFVELDRSYNLFSNETVSDDRAGG